MLELLESGHAGLLSRLASVLTRGIRHLAAASAATGAELHAKFVSDAMPDLSYGKLSSIFDGLEVLIGSLNPNLLDAMAHEHCAGTDAKLIFTTSNYNIATFPPWEWHFVYNPDSGKAEELPPQAQTGRGSDTRRQWCRGAQCAGTARRSRWRPSTWCFATRTRGLSRSAPRSFRASSLWRRGCTRGPCL
jgi:hypothetical protein